MRLPCVNGGGDASIVRLEHPATLEQETALPPDAVRALSLWKLRVGAILSAVDADGNGVRARLVASDRIVPFQRLQFPPPAAPTLALYQALPEKERFELVLQKAVELGVKRIVPYVSERSTTLEARDAGQRKSHRWPEVVLRAAKQCRRPDIPTLGPVMSFAQALEEASRFSLSVILYEGESSMTLKTALARRSVEHAALMVGPEGGFSPAEIARAEAGGVRSASLGPRILRTETAAITGVAVMQFAFGVLG